MATYNNDVNLALGSLSYDPQSGRAYSYYVYDFHVQPNDVISASYPKSTQINGTMRMVLTGTLLGAAQTILTSNYAADLYYVNQLSYPVLYVTVELAAQNEQNVTVSITTTVHHYERPRWGYFGLGVLSSSLAMISIFRSKS